MFSLLQSSVHKVSLTSSHFNADPIVSKVRKVEQHSGKAKTCQSTATVYEVQRRLSKSIYCSYCSLNNHLKLSCIVVEPMSIELNMLGVLRNAFKALPYTGGQGLQAD